MHPTAPSIRTTYSSTAFNPNQAATDQRVPLKTRGTMTGRGAWGLGLRAKICHTGQEDVVHLKVSGHGGENPTAQSGRKVRVHPGVILMQRMFYLGQGDHQFGSG